MLALLSLRCGTPLIANANRVAPDLWRRGCVWRGQARMPANERGFGVTPAGLWLDFERFELFRAHAGEQLRRLVARYP